MARMWPKGGPGSSGGGIDLLVLLCLACVANFCIFSIVMLLCAEGASKDRSSDTSDPYVYGGSGCAAAECGAGCGG